MKITAEISNQVMRLTIQEPGVDIVREWVVIEPGLKRCDGDTNYEDQYDEDIYYALSQVENALTDLMDVIE